MKVGALTSFDDATEQKRGFLWFKLIVANKTVVLYHTLVLKLHGSCLYPGSLEFAKHPPFHDNGREVNKQHAIAA